MTNLVSSGNILNSDGVSRKDGTDFSDRDYVKTALKGKVNISDLTLSKYTGNYGFSVASPVCNEEKAINGVLYYRMDVDFMSQILNQISISKNSYTYLVDGDGIGSSCRRKWKIRKSKRINPLVLSLKFLIFLMLFRLIQLQQKKRQLPLRNYLNRQRI